MILSIDYNVRVSEGEKGYGYKSFSPCCFLTILFVGIASEYLRLDRTAMLLLLSLFISPKIFQTVLDVLRRRASSGISSRA